MELNPHSPIRFRGMVLAKHRYNFSEINVSHIEACEFMLLSDDIATRNTPNRHTGVDSKRGRCFGHVQLLYLVGVLDIVTRLRLRRRRNLASIPGRASESFPKRPTWLLSPPSLVLMRTGGSFRGGAALQA